MENERNLMTTTEAARYLGLKPSYLYKMMMRRAIPYYKPNGKLCFFAKEDLDAWLKRVRVKSQDEIDSQARDRRESPDHSGVSPCLFALRGRLHPGDGRLRHGAG